MKTTPISRKVLESHGFQKDGEVFVFKALEKAEIQYSLDKHSVYMCLTKNDKTYQLNMPCYTWEQLRYYSNIVGINQELELQHPQRFALVVNRCVYCRATDRYIWVPLPALTDQHEIIFHTKYDWTNKVAFSFNPMTQNAMCYTGVFVDYDNLTQNT